MSQSSSDDFIWHVQSQFFSELIVMSDQCENLRWQSIFVSAIFVLFYIIDWMNGAAPAANFCVVALSGLLVYLLGCNYEWSIENIFHLLILWWGWGGYSKLVTEPLEHVNSQLEVDACIVTVVTTLCYNYSKGKVLSYIGLQMYVC
jgi:hypothetical protein